ncbi:hypothetical protein DFH06DRAFT_1350767 [Mycena polygramma]|nr:hypothetical protein DFH06DRAFT_1350767 [Mycena polygramma]
MEDVKGPRIDFDDDMPPLAHASTAPLPAQVTHAPPSESEKIRARAARVAEDVVLREVQKQRITRFLKLQEQKRRDSLLQPESLLSLDDVDCSDMPELADMSDSDDEASLDSDDDVPALVGEDGCWEDEPFVRAPGAGVVHNVQYTTRNIAAAFQSHLLTTGAIPMSYDYACQAPASQYSVVCRACPGPDVLPPRVLVACDANYRLEHSSDGESVERGWAIASGWAMNPLTRSKM